jgi:hypothetical protein
MLRLEGVYGLYVLIPMIVSPFLFFDVFKRLQELLAIPPALENLFGWVK